MKLADWTKATGILGTHPTTECGAVSVIAPTVNMCQRTRAQLWTLEDYLVSSVSGPVVWLLPMKADRGACAERERTLSDSISDAYARYGSFGVE